MQLRSGTSFAPYDLGHTFRPPFLHKHGISIVNVENLTTLPYSKDDQYFRPFMSEIISLFKYIAQLNIFRDQITNFSIN
jgi:ATP-dependent Lon protease